jgi:hypothetical protein
MCTVIFIQPIAGCGFILAGIAFLFLWRRDRKHPDQKKLGVGCIVIGILLLFETAVRSWG